MRRLVPSASPYERIVGFSRAVAAGRHVSVAGTAPIPQDGSNPPEDVFEQARLCLQIVVSALRAAGAEPQHVVRTRVFLVDPADWEAVGRAHGEVFSDIRPANTMVVVKALLDPRWRVEIEADAIVD